MRRDPENGDLEIGVEFGTDPPPRSTWVKTRVGSPRGMRRVKIDDMNQIHNLCNWVALPT